MSTYLHCLVEWKRGITTGVGTFWGILMTKSTVEEQDRHHRRTAHFFSKKAKHITFLQITSMRVRPEEVSRRLRIPELLSSEPVVP